MGHDVFSKCKEHVLMLPAGIDGYDSQLKTAKIINISSMWGTIGASCEVAYSATKSGIHGLTRALAKELAPSNIQVNAIACGVIDTEMNGRLNEKERQDLMDEIPSGRFADPEEVAELALKLTDTPAYMTGRNYWNRWRFHMIDVHHIEQISQDCSLTEFVGTTDFGYNRTCYPGN